MLNYGLLTAYGEKLDGKSVLPEYPRPQLRRDSYLNLNGEWEYAINKSGAIPRSFDGNIIVPFPLESCLSGVRRELGAEEYLIYSRSFDVPEGFIRDITLLHIDAADCCCEVELNGVPIGSHEGGYLPAQYDASTAIRTGQNTLAVIVRDATSADYPIGKQSRKRGGIWYTPVSGIWQTVWLESVCSGHVEEIKITPDIGKKSVRLEVKSASEAEAEIVVLAEGKVVFECRTAERCIEISIDDARLWSPEEPFLYDLTVQLGDDKVTSYFAMREFTVSDGHFLLNGRQYFVNGVLDQGYFNDGIYTPASYDAFRDDISAMKALGFNALRKHIKIEPMMFYYYCDTLGMLVLQDMVNVGKYSFFKDSVLPFAGLRGKRPYVTVSEKQKKRFSEAAAQTVKYLHNCPSVVYYTVFNEGWGQFDGDGLYKIIKALDPTRVCDATSGWFRETLSDVRSEHIYFKPIKLKKSSRTIIVSEFGGYSHSCPDHVFNSEKTFGYKKFGDIQSLEDAFCALYENEILGNLKNGLAGAVYTQVSDVEDETNGILTYDRRICKLSPQRIRPLMERICAQGSDRAP